MTARAHSIGRPVAVGEQRRAGGAPLLVHDDYVAFCEGVRGLCDIDLLQYKRGQMERRVRSFAERRGHAGPGVLPAHARRRRRRSSTRSSTA